MSTTANERRSRREESTGVKSTTSAPTASPVSQDGDLVRLRFPAGLNDDQRSRFVAGIQQLIDSGALLLPRE